MKKALMILGIIASVLAGGIIIWKAVIPFIGFAFNGIAGFFKNIF